MGHLRVGPSLQVPNGSAGWAVDPTPIATQSLIHPTNEALTVIRRWNGFHFTPMRKTGSHKAPGCAWGSTNSLSSPDLTQLHLMYLGILQLFRPWGLWRSKTMARSVRSAVLSNAEVTQSNPGSLNCPLPTSNC